MALVTSNGSNGIVGRIGDVVYVPYKGGTYIRKAPKSGTRVFTRAMLQSQQRFKCMHKFCIQFKHTLIPWIWNDAAERGSGYNFFMKANSPAFARDGSIGDYKLLKLTTGSLPLPFDIRTQREAEEVNFIQVSWKQDLHFSGERLRDELKYIAQNNGVFSEIISTGLARRSCGGTFELPVNFDTATHLYLFFVSNDQRDYSDSCAYAL